MAGSVQAEMAIGGSRGSGCTCRIRSPHTAKQFAGLSWPVACILRSLSTLLCWSAPGPRCCDELFPISHSAYRPSTLTHCCTPFW